MPIDPTGPINRALSVRARDKKIPGLPKQAENLLFLSDDPLVPLPVIDLEPLPILDPEPSGDEGGPAIARGPRLPLGLIVDIRV
jgi:hypothetical protein